MAHRTNLQLAVAAVCLRRKPEAAAFKWMDMRRYKINIIKFYFLAAVEEHIPLCRFRLQILLQADKNIIHLLHADPVKQWSHSGIKQIVTDGGIQTNACAYGKSAVFYHIISIGDNTVVHKFMIFRPKYLF